MTTEIVELDAHRPNEALQAWDEFIMGISEDVSPRDLAELAVEMDMFIGVLLSEPAVKRWFS